MAPTVGDIKVAERSVLALQSRGSFGGGGGGGGVHYCDHALSPSHRSHLQQSTIRYKIREVENKLFEGERIHPTPTAQGPMNQGESEDEGKPIRGLRAVGKEIILVL